MQALLLRAAGGDKQSRELAADADQALGCVGRAGLAQGPKCTVKEAPAPSTLPGHLHCSTMAQCLGSGLTRRLLQPYASSPKQSRHVRDKAAAVLLGLAPA